MMIVVSSYQLVHNDADRVDADQQGRIAMEQIERSLARAASREWTSRRSSAAARRARAAPPSGANSITFYESADRFGRCHARASTKRSSSSMAPVLWRGSLSLRQWVNRRLDLCRHSIDDGHAGRPRAGRARPSSIFTYYRITTSGKI